MGKSLQAVAWIALCTACGAAEGGGEPRLAALDMAVSRLAVADAASLAAMVHPLPPGLRRTYFARDMRLHACASLREDGSIVGENCPPGVVVSGPRVVSPTHSDVRVHFAIDSAASFDIASEIVSNDALRQHGAVLEKAASGAGERSIDYQVHVFEAAPELEARVSVLSAGPVDFRISGLELRVR